MFVCLFACLSVRPSDYLNSNARNCMKVLSEVCLGPKNNPLDFVLEIHDPDYDANPGSDPDRTDLHQTSTKSMSRANKLYTNMLFQTISLVLIDICAQKITADQNLS